jgi:biopolymer transport protein TolR
MNVTPLVDVVLVLLIIFMVVIPALQQGLQIELAGILNVDDESESKGQPFALAITRDNLLYFEEELVSSAGLLTKLRAASKAQPNRRVLVRADKGAEYTRVREIYRVVQQVGFPGVSLRVNRRQEDP